MIIDYEPNIFSWPVLTQHNYGGMITFRNNFSKEAALSNYTSDYIVAIWHCKLKA